MMRQYSKKGFAKVIALIAFVFLGKAYATGYENVEYERVSYKFESIYPDKETMDEIEDKMLGISTRALLPDSLSN